MDITKRSDACDPRPYLHHQALAIAWARYTSTSQRQPSDQRVARIMRLLTAAQLERMLALRGTTVQA